MYHCSDFCPQEENPREEASMNPWDRLFGQRTLGSLYVDFCLKAEGQDSKWACPFDPIDSSHFGERCSQRRAGMGLSKVQALVQGLLRGSKGNTVNVIIVYTMSNVDKPPSYCFWSEIPLTTVINVVKITSIS